MESKARIIQHYKQSIQFVEGLRGLSNDQWFTPIAEGKWSTCEIIGHLIPWDRFLLEQRLPSLNAKIKPESPKVQDVNTNAALDSKEKKKEDLIQEFIEVRWKLLRRLHELSQEVFEQTFVIGKSNLTLVGYFDGLIKHDLHHFQQITNFLKTSGN
ncbi:DinB family protein [Rummeliibacillus pycnus]|uniref:DinB family protein n=1 Tax=Rummeliibacillus pycnus TaxID=101070 RepID=UPI000C9B1A08|nr:DinB family protein [Rummeliibacillus pycnus]